MVYCHGHVITVMALFTSKYKFVAMWHFKLALSECLDAVMGSKN